MSSNRPGVSGRTDESSDWYRVDWTRAPSVSMAVVDAVATAEGVEPTELDPLNDAIDPDALDALFASTARRGDAPVGEVSLRFGGHHVTVRGSGELVVRPAGPSAGS